MAKGFFTQSAMVLFERPVTLEAVAACLDPFDVVKWNEANEARGWGAERAPTDAPGLRARPSVRSELAGPHG